jgi:serine/threonine protein kinase
VGQVCGGLAYAHARGVIHRDLKPSNLLITSEGAAKIADFGVAHLMQNPGLTQPGQTLGTPAYMSPEQIRGERLTPASDVFSLGIVLYELLIGRRPFMEDDVESVTAKILNERPAPPRKVKPGIPRSVQRIVLKCLRKRPEQRFRTPAALERAISRALGGGPNDWESLVRQYLELLPPAGEVPSRVGHYLRVPGHSARRLRRLALTASLIAAFAWAGLVLAGAVPAPGSGLTWLRPPFSFGPAWSQPKPSGPEPGQRPPRTQGTRPAGRGAGSQQRP